MIYIDQTTHPYFQSLARLVSFHLKQPNEITSDYTKKGLWILSYWSQLYKSVDKITANGCKYIAVQTEPMHIKGHEAYKTFLNNAESVWDYTKNFEIGYSDYFRIQAEEAKDIDVLFYGKVNPRRKEIIDKIPNITVVDNVYSPEIYTYIRRAKIVLSLKFHEKSNADWTRIAPLLSNRAFIIAERVSDNRFNDLIHHIVISERKFIPSLCKAFLKSPLERIELADKGYEYLKTSRLTQLNTIY